MTTKLNEADMAHEAHKELVEVINKYSNDMHLFTMIGLLEMCKAELIADNMDEGDTLH